MKYLTTALLIGVLSTGSLVLNTTAYAHEHGMRNDMHEMGGHHGNNCWRASLTDEQAKQLAKLKLAYKQKVVPLKARIKQARIDLALLISTDQPEDRLVDKKIDEIVKLKAEKLRVKTDHQMAVRQLLTAEQRVNFDMKLLRKVNRNDQGHAHSGWHH